MHIIEFGKPGQLYWYFGIGMAALGHLYLATGDDRFLKGGLTLFQWVQKCLPWAFEALTAAKGLVGEHRCSTVARVTLDSQKRPGLWETCCCKRKSQTAHGCAARNTRATTSSLSIDPWTPASNASVGYTKSLGP